MAETPSNPRAKAVGESVLGWLTGLVLFLFVAVEFMNFGVLPTALQTVDNWTAQQKTETARSMAAVAKRLQAALARKDAGEARHKEQVAANSPVVLAARTTVAQQQGTINAEKAKQEDRRAAAEAAKNAADAKAAQIQAEITDKTTRAIDINNRAEAIKKCWGAMVRESNDPDPIALAITDPAFDSGNNRQQLAAFAAIRKRCVPENDIPAAQLYSRSARR